MSYALLQYAPYFNGHGEALLVRVPNLTTDVWGVFNPETGEIRYGSRIDEVHPIASITKLFTAYAVMKTESEGVTTTITWADLNTEGQAGKLTYGKIVSLRDLLFPLLIESSNDAGSAIARVLDTKLVDTTRSVISDHALTHTTINDPTGLGAANTSTINDLAHFYTYLRTTYPQVIDITQLRMYISPETGLVNNNPIRSLNNFTGGKHGFTVEAGRTFVGTLKLPKGKGEIGIVLLRSSDLLGDVTKILDSFN